MPRVTLVYGPAGPAFSITEDCAMPTIKVTANLVDVTPDPEVPLSYQWNVTLVFVGGACVHSVNRRISHPEINATTQTNTFTIPFSQVRGGDLTVSVSSWKCRAYCSQREVAGRGDQSLDRGALEHADHQRRLQETDATRSGLRQFRTPSCPLFSGDNLGGVGICQITSPRPTDDQVWSWKENLNAGLLFYKAKEGVARAYPRRFPAVSVVRASSEDFPQPAVFFSDK